MDAQPNHHAVLRPSDLPSPPKSALQILRVCSRTDVNSAEIAKLVANDPILSAELLRVVNSAFFGIAKQVSSIKQAIVILGNKSLHNLALCISTRDIIKHDDMPGFAIDVFWEDSLRRASCAKLLGSLMQLDQDECFTAGLLQDFGLLVMFFLNKDKCHYWLDMRRMMPDERYRREIEIFFTTHDVMMQNLATAWGLPEQLGQCLGEHHKIAKNDVPKTQQTLTAILHCADWLSAVYSTNDPRTAIASCRRVMTDFLGLEIEQLESLLVAVPEATENAAAALGLRINQQTDYEQLLRDANAKLVAENLDFQELNWQLEKTIKERDAIAQELNRELDLAREIQRSLLPGSMQKGFPVTGINVSARCLSGDFYDYFVLDDGRIFFNLGDVSGKGITAALLMTKISSLFRCLGKTIHDLPQLMTIINAEIVETSIRGMFASMIAGLYDPKSGTVKTINAGHPPAFLLGHDGTVKTFEAQSPPLGIKSDVQYKEVSFNLNKGCLYLYSDGVIEGRLDNGTELGLKGLLTQFLSLRKKPVKQRLDEIVYLLAQSGESLHDDITLLAIEDRAPENRTKDSR